MFQHFLFCILISNLLEINIMRIYCLFNYNIYFYRFQSKKSVSSFIYSHFYICIKGL